MSYITDAEISYSVFGKGYVEPSFFALNTNKYWYHGRDYLSLTATKRAVNMGSVYIELDVDPVKGLVPVPMTKTLYKWDSSAPTNADHADLADYDNYNLWDYFANKFAEDGFELGAIWKLVPFYHVEGDITYSGFYVIYEMKEQGDDGTIKLYFAKVGLKIDMTDDRDIEESEILYKYFLKSVDTTDQSLYSKSNSSMLKFEVAGNPERDIL
jgi:hypothetical protein